MLESQKYILLLFLFFLASFGVKPQQNQIFIGDIDYESPDYILMFADHLHQTGDYKRATIEYQRYLSTTGSIGLKNCGFKLADSYRKSGGLENSLVIYKNLQQINTRASEYWWIAQSEIGQTYFLFGDYTRSISAFNKITSTSSKLRTEREIWLGINRLFLGQWDLAHTHFSSTDITLKPSANTISYYQSLVQEGRRLPVKNPFLAGTLSLFFPGLGRIYLGRPGDFFNTLTTVTAVGLLSYNGFQHQQERSIKGWSFALIGSVFYLSNIYGSWLGAKIHNRQINENFWGKIVVPLPDN